MNSKFNFTGCKFETVIAEAHAPINITSYVNVKPSDEEMGNRRDVTRVEFSAENELKYDERYKFGAVAEPENPQQDKGKSKIPLPAVDRAEEYCRLKLRLKKLLEEEKCRLEEFKEALNADKSMEYSQRDMGNDSTAHKVLERLQQMTKMSEDNVEPLLRLVRSAVGAYGSESWWNTICELLQMYQTQTCGS